jgi:hypothetical protein
MIRLWQAQARPLHWEAPARGLAGGNAAAGGGERELGAHAGARPAGAVEEDPAAERLYAVLEASQAGAAGEAGAPGAVVADLEEQGIAGDLYLARQARRVQ